MSSFSSNEMDVFTFDEAHIQQQGLLTAELDSWNPFESCPFSPRRHTFGAQNVNALAKRWPPVYERVQSEECVELRKSTDELLKLANSFSGQSILDPVEKLKKADVEDDGQDGPKTPMPFYKTLAEMRRQRFQHQQPDHLRWSWDVCESNKIVRGEDRVVGRRLSGVPGRASIGGYATAVKKTLIEKDGGIEEHYYVSPRDHHHSGSADSGMRTPTDIEFRSMDSAHEKLTPIQRFRQLKSRSQDGGYFEFSDFLENDTNGNDNESASYRGRTRSVKRRQFVNGIHLKFIKPAKQCPNWDKPNHREEEPSCTLWHPKAKCYFYPNCRLTAELCGFAHPFCADHKCKCVPGKLSSQLNHLTRI